MNPIIEFKEVDKSFGPLRVLDGLNLSINQGEKLALIGPSGSGKTTILRILMTLENISGGHVFVGGEPLWHEQRGADLVPAGEKHLHEMRTQIGMVFQHFNLFPHLSAIQNIMQPQILVQKKSKSDARAKASELLAQVLSPGDRVLLRLGNRPDFPVAYLAAIAVGLVVNELFTNAVKHALPNGRHGTIDVKFCKDGDALVLCVTDDGGQAPAGAGTEGGLGSRLIKAFAQNLDADIETDASDRGTCVTLRFRPSGNP